jgi:pyruvate-formate lyase-activating enzyme
MKPTDEQHKTRYFCENPETRKMEEVFPESEIGDDELVIPMFWGGRLGYVTVPGTEFYGRVPERA